MGRREIGRVLEGSSESPDMRIGMTSANFQTCANVFEAPPRLYMESIALESDKVKDLEKLPKFVPEPQRQFYVNIISNPTIKDSIDNEDND